MASSARLAALAPFPVDQAPASLAGGVVAIGNFDGLHRGHAALIAAARAEAARRKVPSLVLTFEPHPRTVFRPEKPVFQLSPLRAKARLLKALAVDGLAVGTFDRAFASLTPDEFIERVLVGHLKATGVVVGFNFAFGKARAGTSATLAESGRQRGFDAIVVDAVAAEGETVASSAIRAALTGGEVARANTLLGHRWLVVGEVEHGDGRGHGLGFPTANLRLGADCGLRHGIYAVRLQRPGGAIHDGVASFGIRPTFGGGGAPLLEAFVFDFNADLYGEEVAVSFIDWIRPEAKFSGIAELVEAIHRDVSAARTILAAAGPGTDFDRKLAVLA